MTSDLSASSAVSSCKSSRMPSHQPRVKVLNHLSASAFTRKFLSHRSLCHLSYFQLTFSLSCLVTSAKGSLLTPLNRDLTRYARWAAKHRHLRSKMIVPTRKIYVIRNQVSKLSRKQKFAKIGCKASVATGITALLPTDKSRFRKNST